MPEELSRRRLRSRLLVAFAILLAVIAVITLLPGLANLRSLLAHAKPDWLALGVVLKLLSGLGYVAVFQDDLLPADELAGEHPGGDVRARRQRAVPHRRRRRARAGRLGAETRRHGQRGDRPANRVVLPADQRPQRARRDRARLRARRGDPPRRGEPAADRPPRRRRRGRRDRHPVRRSYRPAPGGPRQGRLLRASSPDAARRWARP